MRLERNAEGARWKCPTIGAKSAETPTAQPMTLLFFSPSRKSFESRNLTVAGGGEMGNARPVPTSVGQSRAGAAQKFENDARQMLSAERALKHWRIPSLYFVHVTHEPQVVFWRPAFGGSRVFRRGENEAGAAWNGERGRSRSRGSQTRERSRSIRPRARSPRTHASALFAPHAHALARSPPPEPAD